MAANYIAQLRYCMYVDSQYYTMLCSVTQSYATLGKVKYLSVPNRD